MTGLKVRGPGPLGAGQSGDSFPIDHPYGKGKTHDAVSIVGGGGSNAVDLVTAGYDSLWLIARMTATAAGDLALRVYPFEDDGVTVAQVNIAGVYLPPIEGGTVAFNVKAYVRQRYNLKGIDKVRVEVTNSNAVAETATVVYYLEK